MSVVQQMSGGELLVGEVVLCPNGKQFHLEMMLTRNQYFDEHFYDVVVADSKEDENDWDCYYLLLEWD